MKFDENGHRISGGLVSTQANTEERLYNLDSEFKTISSENLEVLYDMTPKERVAEVKSILGQMMKMEESLKWNIATHFRSQQNF